MNRFFICDNPVVASCSIRGSTVWRFAGPICSCPNVPPAAVTGPPPARPAVSPSPCSPSMDCRASPVVNKKLSRSANYPSPSRWLRRYKED